MQLQFAEEHRAQRAALRGFLAAAGCHETSTSADPELPFDRSLWRRMADELGLQSLRRAEPGGAGGGSRLEQGIALSELGRVAYDGPFLTSAVVAAHAIEAAEGSASPDLADLASGRTVAAVAFARSGPGRHSIGATVRATRGDDGWRLDGQAGNVAFGVSANVLVVAATTDDGPAMFRVDALQPGLTAVRQRSFDLRRELALLGFDGVRATPLAMGGRASAAFASAMDLGLIALACEEVGGAQRCLELAVDYAKVRVQFGRTIGSFQAIKHRCARMLIDVESAWATVLYALQQELGGVDEARTLAAMTALHCWEVYARCAASAIQVFGGIGFTWEAAPQWHHRRVRGNTALFLSPTELRQELRDLVVGARGDSSSGEAAFALPASAQTTP